MTAANEPREFLSGKLTEVDVGRIEKKVRDLWKQATNDTEGIVGDVVRAVSFTLVLFSHDESTENELSNILDDIMSFHPCRAILTFLTDKAPHSMHAYVSARCHLLGDKRHVCSEQITVHANGAGPEELASVVSPLVLADLPVVLWWRSRALAGDVMDALHRCARKIIFDSGYQPFEIGVLQQAADLVIQRGDCIWLADLNWRRLLGWRRSLAEAFDGFPMPPEYLQRIKGVEISVRGTAQTGPMSAQALLLIGWLASRLNWHHERDKTAKNQLRFRTDNHYFNVALRASDENIAAQPGGIDSVVIEFDDNRKLDVEVECKGSSFLITSREMDAGSNEATRVDEHFAEGVLVGQELEVMSRDRIFEQSLLIAGEISRLIKS
jgi:glucose-6-phosphate dehydrogenase assembly protein OpcA